MARVYHDTIAAIATPPGRGGIGVVRISGDLAPHILATLCGRVPAPRQAMLADFCGIDEHGAKTVLDRGIALYFPAPNSFTGEAVAELHGHGGPVVLDLLLRRILSCGARLARAGEFSERAFINNKLDLSQAEAIADLIDSASAQAARNAMRSLQGVFSRRVQQLLEELISVRVFVEASIDFPEEEVDFLADGALAQRLEALLQSLAQTRAAAHNGVLLRDGMTLVLAGKPNAGKSSLMNRLAGRDTAIVTAIAGTTRDLLREQITLDGMPLHLIDTAGLRESGDEIEREGIRRAIEEIRRANRLLLILDSSSADSPQQLIDTYFRGFADQLPPVTVVLNKCDLSGIAPGPNLIDGYSAIAISALHGEGMEALQSHLLQCAGFEANAEGDFSARRRHLDALDQALACVRSGQTQLQQHAAGELLAEHLREAQLALGQITGEFRSDELLGRIFASFCIGK